MRLLMPMALVVAGVAALDAARGRHWDQFAMLVAIGVLILVSLAVQSRFRNAVRVRPDLLAWARRHAALTDDEPALVIDRALSAYRAQMLPGPEAHDDVP